MRLFSPEYYALCAGGGTLAAATTHLAITPLDVLKVNMQVRVRFVAVTVAHRYCNV
jgi:solute carrier family 25 (mitochondrial phosphate transporter), member 3